MKHQSNYPKLADIFRADDSVIDISVTVPLKNEESNIVILANEIFTIFEADKILSAKKFELIFVDDASTDGTAAALSELVRNDSRVRVLTHEKTCGQSAALRTAILYAKGELIVTLDGDGQNDPKDIPILIEPFYQDYPPTALALIAGQRTNRQDVSSKKIASRLANRIRQAMLKDGADDTGCGLKVFRRDVFLLLPFFDHMHRYLPALFLREGMNVLYRSVSHRARARGVSKYGNLQRFLVGLIDLPCVLWLLKRRKLSRVIVGSEK